MELRDQRVLLTGATGGIGRQLAQRLGDRGARLGLVGRREEVLALQVEELLSAGVRAEAILADLTEREACERVLSDMRKRFGGVDILINNAGMQDFAEFQDHDPLALEALMNTNLLAPMRLARLALPDMLARGSGRIVNIGSVFGSIGFACFVGYSASKFGLRGFSEALRRELHGSGVGVTFVAPRAVRTGLNSEAVYRMAQRVKMHLDDPDWVAQRIVTAIEQERKDVYLGFPEALFVRFNALFPRMVDGALRGQNKVMRAFARES